MIRNSIVVDLTEIDSTTNKRKKVVHDYLIIKNNLEMRHGIILEFIEEDGSPIIPGNELQRQLFLPKQITKETDAPGNPDQVSELEYWQNIPLASYPKIAALSDEVKASLGEVRISELVYWLIEQSILKGNVEGKY